MSKLSSSVQTPTFDNETGQIYVIGSKHEEEKGREEEAKMERECTH